jgi:hypothetical protein
MWIVRKRFPFTRQGVQVTLTPGSEIPEVATWTEADRAFWVRRGYFAEVPRPTKGRPVVISVFQPQKLRPVEMTLTDESEPEDSETVSEESDDVVVPRTKQGRRR